MTQGSICSQGYCRKLLDIDVDDLVHSAILQKIKVELEFITLIQNALLDDPSNKLSRECIQCLWDPLQAPVTIEKPDFCHSITMYLALEHSSQNAYNQICCSTQANFPESPAIHDLLSFHVVEKKIAEYMGVEYVKHDMCLDLCTAFTGLFAELEACPICTKSHWDPGRLHASNGQVKAAAKKFTTIPVGPQLQARYWSAKSAQDMQYLHGHTQEILHQLSQTREIPIIDDVVMGLDYLGPVLDGDIQENDIVLMVSLDGDSNCWILIWIFANLSPQKRYQKAYVQPGDASCNLTFQCNPYLLFPTADGSSLVGKNGCHLYCGILGHHKTHDRHYYPVLIKPRDWCLAGSDYPDLDVFNLPLGGSETYASNLQRLRKTETGITKAPLILGLNCHCSLGVPYCMTTDIMHLAGNLSNLLIALYVESWEWAIFMDNLSWERYGVSVANAGPHLLGSFGTRPRNIAEKLSSGYKTWKFQLHIFRLGPILLYNILPDKYFANYCKLNVSLTTAHYREDRIHFVRPCVHQVVHLMSETIRKGPPICYAQWTMERTIGNLAQEIRQPSNPYSNLAQEGVHCCRTNSLLATIPELSVPSRALPESAIDLGDGLILLPKCDHYFNGQTTRTAWHETLKAQEKLRISWNVTVSYVHEGHVRFDKEDGRTFHNVVLVKLHLLPEPELLQISSQTLAACALTDKLMANGIKTITTVIAMVPRRLTLRNGEEVEQFCALSQPGLDALVLKVTYDIYEDDDDGGGEVE
ncbi:hypothetical protein HD554DRAFT_2205612 [Boletus coccyginus]|nr:hypothetical protein HD554DRAFT_2205612 [Boletus coccyginus]